MKFRVVRPLFRAGRVLSLLLVFSGLFMVVFGPGANVALASDFSPNSYALNQAATPTTASAPQKCDLVPGQKPKGLSGNVQVRYDVNPPVGLGYVNNGGSCAWEVFLVSYRMPTMYGTAGQTIYDTASVMVYPGQRLTLQVRVPAECRTQVDLVADRVIDLENMQGFPYRDTGRLIAGTQAGGSNLCAPSSGSNPSATATPATTTPTAVASSTPATTTPTTVATSAPVTTTATAAVTSTPATTTPTAVATTSPATTTPATATPGATSSPAPGTTATTSSPATSPTSGGGATTTTGSGSAAPTMTAVNTVSDTVAARTTAPATGTATTGSGGVSPTAAAGTGAGNSGGAAPTSSGGASPTTSGTVAGVVASPGTTGSTGVSGTETEIPGTVAGVVQPPQGGSDQSAANSPAVQAPSTLPNTGEGYSSSTTQLWWAVSGALLALLGLVSSLGLALARRKKL